MERERERAQERRKKEFVRNEFTGELPTLAKKTDLSIFNGRIYIRVAVLGKLVSRSKPNAERARQ